MRAVEALGAAIGNRDADAVRALYSDDVVVWHGSTGVGQSKAENTGFLAAVFAVTLSLEYVDIRRHSIAGGVLQQHTLVGTFDDGTPLPPLHVCMVMKVADDKITRIDEYFDGTSFAALAARLAPSS
jgi:ketosteroid isomerase-like protein